MVVPGDSQTVEMRSMQDERSGLVPSSSSFRECFDVSRVTNRSHVTTFRLFKSLDHHRCQRAVSLSLSLKLLTTWLSIESDRK